MLGVGTWCSVRTQNVVQAGYFKETREIKNSIIILEIPACPKERCSAVFFFTQVC